MEGALDKGPHKQGRVLREAEERQTLRAEWESRESRSAWPLNMGTRQISGGNVQWPSQTVSRGTLGRACIHGEVPSMGVRTSFEENMPRGTVPRSSLEAQPSP